MTEPKLFFGNTSTQIYKNVTTSNMIITNNSNDVLIISSSENVGIKNNSPSYDLDVNGDINTNNTYKINGNNVITENSLGTGVTSSNLKEIGTLNSLNVSGNTRLNNLTVTDTSTFNDVNVNGNLNVVGTFTTTNSVLTNVTQNFVELSMTNTNNILDSGIYSQYIDSGVTKYKGIFNDSSENDKFKIFKNYELLPSSTININHASFELGDLDLNNINSNQNSSVDTITENITITNSARINSANVEQDLSVSGDFHTNNFHINISRVGINTTEPTYLLDVSGIINAKEYKLDGDTIFTDGTISTGITSSNLQEVGTLNDLTVTGNTYLNANNFIDRATISNDLRVNGNIGIQTLPDSRYRINSNGDINTNSNYKCNGNNVLSKDTLGTGVTSSNLQQLGILNNINLNSDGSILIGLPSPTNSNNKIDVTNGDINIMDNYKINNNVVLNENELGLSVTQSNLQTFGDIISLNITGNLSTTHLNVSDKLSFGTNFKKNSLNVTNSIGIYNLVDTPNLDMVFNKSTSNNGLNNQKVSAINFKTDIGGFISNNNNDNTITDLSNIEIYSNGILNDTNRSTDIVFKNAEINTTIPREIMRLKENGKLNSLNGYQINNNDVLTSDTLGTGITSSNLQNLGILNEIQVSNKLNISNSVSITSDVYIDGTFYRQNGKLYEFSNISINTTSGDLYNLTNNLSLGITDAEEKLHIEEGNIYLGTTIPNNYTNGILKFNKHGNHDAIYFGEEMQSGTKITIDEAGSCVNIQTGGSGFDATSQNINNRSGKFKIENYNSTSNEYETNFYVDTTGYVGIATTSPASIFHINSTDSMVVPVGTENQRVSTQIGSFRFNSDFGRFEGYNGTNWKLLSSQGSIIDLDNDTYISVENDTGSDNDQIKFYTAGSLKGVINTNGNFGINVTTPSTKLHISGTDGLVIPVGNTIQRVDVTGAIRYNTQTQSFEGYSGTWGSLGGVIDVDQDTYIIAEDNPNDDNDELKFYTAGNQNMILNVSGNLGISTSNPLTKLHISSTDGLVIPVGNTTERVDVTGAIRYNTQTQSFEGYSGTWGSLGGVIDVDQDTYISAEDNPNDDNDELKFYTSGNERMRIDSSGYIGIGTTAVNGKVEIAGNFGSVSLSDKSYGELLSAGVGLGDTATNSYSLYADGKIAASEFNAISDIRVKENVIERNINEDIQIINQMNIYNYDFIDKLNFGDNKKIGFIAQNIQQINNNFINKSKKIIPSIYKKFNLIDKNTFECDIELKINDIIRVQIFDIDKQSYFQGDITIKNKVDNYYNFDNNQNIDIKKGIFIYGHKVDDFLTIDTNQILAVNTNVIKYLYKNLTDLQEKYKNDILNIKHRLEQLEKN